MEMTILVCGTRNLQDYKKVKEELDIWWPYCRPKRPLIIHGAAKGADKLADRAAKELGYAVRKFPANWDEHGKAAGAIRNQQMLVEGRPDMVVAFWDGRVQKCGTFDMMQRATRAGVEVMVIPCSGGEQRKASNQPTLLT